MPKTHPGGQPARRAELGAFPFRPRLSLNSLSTLPSLTSSTFTEAGSFSTFLTSSTEKVKLGAWGSDCSAPVPTPHQERWALWRVSSRHQGTLGEGSVTTAPGHHARASGWTG